MIKLTELVSATGAPPIVLRIGAYSAIAVSLLGIGYYHGSNRATASAKAAATALENTRNIAAVAQYRKNEQAERIAIDALAKAQTETVNAKLKNRRDADSVTALLNSLPVRANTRDCAGTNNTTSAAGADAIPDPYTELFRRSARRAGELAVRADELTVQVTELQAYASACYQLTK